MCTRTRINTVLYAQHILFVHVSALFLFRKKFAFLSANLFIQAANMEALLIFEIMEPQKDFFLSLFPDLFVKTQFSLNCQKDIIYDLLHNRFHTFWKKHKPIKVLTTKQRSFFRGMNIHAS